ncbi:hemerythrin family protein [Lacimicrobium sp. SS2-24]|uniref:bacteriohemerythrin n=1 Tax=Lacimicrobium sp. SS2-24 TaxID=2005569 RepID=UPI000B4A9090|nr:hemerythrin family protein [Lacimicrobium sp. SS2-24]
MPTELLLWSHHCVIYNHTRVNEQHAHLFESVNKLYLRIKDNAKQDTVLANAEALYQDTVTHFREEEALFSECTGDQFTLHRLQHKHYLEALRGFCDRLHSDINLSVESLTDQLRHLADWYQAHILTSDKQLEDISSTPH